MPPPYGWTPPPPPPTRTERPLSPVGIAALVVALGGFLLRLAYWSSHTVNGVTVDCEYHDYGPLLAGPAAIVLGLLTVARSGRPGLNRQRELGLGLLVVAIGLVHLLRFTGAVTLDLSGRPAGC
jgi:hypothetical protein